MNYVIEVEVIHGFEDLPDCLGGVFLCKLAILADTVEQLSTSSQLCDDVVLVLTQPIKYQAYAARGRKGG